MLFIDEREDATKLLADFIKMRLNRWLHSLIT